jgi:hypothetical protein
MKNSTPALNITVGFSTTRLLTSRLIRWATRSSCSHAFIAFDDRALRMRMVMQAASWGYELRPWKRWIRENLLVAEFTPQGQPLDETLRLIAGKLGSRFDYKSALLTGIKGKFDLWHKSRFSLNLNRSPWKLTCSEAVVRFLQLGKYRTASGLDPETTSPGELLERILGNENEFRAVYLCHYYLRFDRKLAVPGHLLKAKYVFKKDRDPAA